jgi:hypothetical protein
MYLSEIPEFKAYPTVFDFVKGHLDMQFADVRAMLRLPLPSQGITPACNFAVTAVLCNMISGLSVTLFMPASPIVLNNKGKIHWIGSGATFKQLLEKFYPWQSGENGEERAKVLYDIIRNPAAHALGVYGKAGYQIFISRPQKGWTEQEMDTIERSTTRPSGLQSGLSGAGTQWNLFADGLYRDVFHMIWRLAQNHDQMSAAEWRFSADTIIWRDGDVKKWTP